MLVKLTHLNENQGKLLVRCFLPVIYPQHNRAGNDRNDAAVYNMIHIGKQHFSFGKTVHNRLEKSMHNNPLYIYYFR